VVKGPAKTVGYSPRPLQSPTDIKFLVILSHADWLGMTFAWKPPAVHLREGRAMSKAGLLAMPIAKAEPLIRCAARNCFWDLGKTLLRRLAVHEGVEPGKDATLFQLLHGLVAKCAGVPEGQVFEILNLRLRASYDACEELFMEDDCVDLVAAEDQEELIRTIRDTKEAVQEVNTYRQELRKARRSSKGVTQGSAKASLLRKLVLKRPSGDITLEMAKQMAPPTCIGMKMCTHGGRWWAQTASGECKSRSWQMYGFNESCRLILAWLWSDYLEEQQLDTSACPIEGLFKKGSFDSKGVSGASAGAGSAMGPASSASAG